MSLCNLFIPFSDLHPLFGADGRLPSKAQGGFVLATAQSTFGPFESGIKKWCSLLAENTRTYCVFCEHLTFLQRRFQF